MSMYIVISKKWGEDNTHSYIAGWHYRLSKAKTIADDERNRRGGAYSCVVYKIKQRNDVQVEVYRAKGMGG